MLRPWFRLPLALGAGLILAGAVFLALRPSAEPPKEIPPASAASAEAPASASAPERSARRHRLADAGWRLIETREPGEDRRLPQPAAPLALIGGAEILTPEWFVLVRAVHPLSAEARVRFPRLPADAEERGECGGLLIEGGLIVTAAHCIVGRDGAAPLRLEVCVQPLGRSACRESFVIRRAAVDASFEHDGAAGYRDDRALVFLPEDPGGGAELPQTPRAELEPGERVQVFAMGTDARGDLAERVKFCAQEVADVRRTIVETRAGEACRIRRADSGSPAGRIVEGRFAPTLIVSNYDAADEDRNFYAPLRPDKIRAAAKAWR